MFKKHIVRSLLHVKISGSWDNCRMPNFLLGIFFSLYELNSMKLL